MSLVICILVRFHQIHLMLPVAIDDDVMWCVCVVIHLTPGGTENIVLDAVRIPPLSPWQGVGRDSVFVCPLVCNCHISI